MRLHIQNPPDDPVFAITPAQWSAAIARAPALRDIEVSIAHDDAGFAAAMPTAEALLTWTKQARLRLPRGTLPGLAPRLRIVAFTSAGLDRLAPFDWVPPGVRIVNNSGTHGDKAGEFGMMAILMLRNHMPFFAENQRRGAWQSRFASTLAGETLTVVGVGTLGAGVARRARQFGMRVLGVRHGGAPHPDCDAVLPLAEALPRAQFLLLTCPLTEATRGLLSRERIAQLPRGACVVNLSRGAVWDQEAVCDALAAGQLGGCLTDVADPEPLPPEHRLWRTPGMIVTPHMSSDDPATYNDRTLDILLANLLAEREARPLPNLVDLTKGY